MELYQNILDFDRELFLYLNSFYNDFFDTIMLLVTRKETWFPFYLIIVVFFIKNYRSKSMLILVFLALTIIASDQISVLIKETVQRLRPVHEPSIEHLVHNVLRKGGLFGFVSSHAANTFAIFIFTSKIFKNKSYFYLLFFWAVLVSYSRIYSGVHYPLDILGGAVLGWFLAVVFYKLLMFLENHFFIARTPKIGKTKITQAQTGTVFLVFGILSLTVIITTYILHYYNYL
ncbi:MAG: phosphatase PAP2 family protein [Prolixibacteraceae bacterium]|jgi:undecaprenyl-diphosphatase|nr:phosphatase PAP2 family protein [Prolixibacteraceae bacterium]MBT6005884.1 phosphatase PAP2 family protein [Prolixibacteraceae bacterium]MBT6766251.1 phosphatase PAP2 family protein [Prolixibacteraceae bacterium]MBT6997745.1 phosphatase PAP2 family protein [Prolixibacteraceae bacterium]MBT7396483.1 phosphatase PAP2 family protein [Prolixibacteraceae bacterium]